MITIIGCNKGGAGKSTTAVNVAIALAMRGFDVVLVDADFQRSAAKWYGYRQENNIQPSITLIEKRDNISQTLKQLDEKYDHVIVDVAGKNSREFITGGTVAHQIIAPHQCSQFDLETLIELEQQVTYMRDLNPDLKVYLYQTMATTNPILRGTERHEFLEFLKFYDQMTPLKSVACTRKSYRDAIPTGHAVVELNNPKAKQEVLDLIEEVFDGAA
ncbi:chromosome partitioning protein ParA (plasmid) [Aeromonas media]|uniref:Chromosome partitioning protein ParA n=1 Tax=Aeromonas media TaxID=651 RepID=A0ABX6NYB3_AERME|nr:AAA family ATPase [Aeromonas media]QJT37030.1 chromosome partitioning protein ParA [Aeromonas media]QJT41371.1 chromosome partitioning protein ParA [Aeromonas media]